MAFVTNIANAILNAYFRNTAPSLPATIYVSLHTSDPGENGANEVTGGSYAREAVTFGDAAATKSIANTTDVLFEGMPAVTVSHVGIWGSASGGTFYWGGALTASKTTGAGDSL
jgi:hypothetical protein